MSKHKGRNLSRNVGDKTRPAHTSLYFSYVSVLLFNINKFVPCITFNRQVTCYKGRCPKIATYFYAILPRKDLLTNKFSAFYDRRPIANPKFPKLENVLIGFSNPTRVWDSCRVLERYVSTSGVIKQLISSTRLDNNQRQFVFQLPQRHRRLCRLLFTVKVSCCLVLEYCCWLVCECAAQFRWVQ